MGRGQQVIFDQIPVTSWDLMIGILWLRYGTPSGGANPSESGTHEEFTAAYEMWKQIGKPRIVFYRCTRSPEDITKLNLDDLTKINQFFKEFETGGRHEGLYRAYDTAENFERLVRNHVIEFIVQYSEQVGRKIVTPETLQVYAPKIPNNLPRRQAFFGRVKEMETVMRALSPADRTWGVLVDGIGGIGKSAIAIEAAYRVQEEILFDAFVFVTAKTNILEPTGIKELKSPARTLDEFLNETSRILGQPGITKLTGEEKRRALIEVLRSLRTLLIYDNLETLTKEEQEGIADFLRELPQGCKAVITSRRRGGEGGVWLRLEKLDWDAARGIIENQISLDIGLASKLNRVGKSRWQELFDETNGSPLALVHTMGLMRIRGALTFDGALKMLRGNRDADLQKFIFQEAGKELTDNDKAALGALSFFVPSTTFEAWMEVAELSRNALETTIDRLSAFSLVDVLTGEERYALHPLTRAFVQHEMLAEANVAYETGMRFAQYWVDYSERYGGWERDSYKTYDRLEVEWMNLDTAANWLWVSANVKGESLEDKNAGQKLSKLVRALQQFLIFYGRLDESIELYTQAYEIDLAMQNWAWAGWRAYDVAIIYLKRSLLDDAALWTDRCVKLWEREGSNNEQAEAKRIRGLVAQERRDYPNAIKIFQESLSIFRDLGMDREVSVVLGDLGYVVRLGGEYDRAEVYFRDALSLSRKTGDKEEEVYLLGMLGTVDIDRGKPEEACKWFEQALPLAKEVGRQDYIAYLQYRLACTHEAEGQIDLALPLAQDALKIYGRLRFSQEEKARELVDRLEKRIRDEK
jgi:tetratricopeptide (TPR) repeat protein